MKTRILGIAVLLVGLGVLTAFLTLFTVHQTQQALVLQFGEPRRIITEPGLSWKIPFIQTVEYFDKRILDLDSTPQEVIAADQKRLVVDAFARFRITDPLLFFQAVRDEGIARSRLGSILDSSLRRVLGAASFEAVVRDHRDQLMQLIRKQLNNEAQGFGVNIVDVRIKRADLPEANSQAIYRRMQTERQQEAAQIRARGEEIARRIRADADRQVTVLLAEAERDGQRTRGEGDSTRNRIFAEAFNQDPDFFAFYRSMQAYEQGLAADQTRLIMSPNSDFFRYFKNPRGTEQPQIAAPTQPPMQPPQAAASADRGDAAASEPGETGTIGVIPDSAAAAAAEAETRMQ